MTEILAQTDAYVKTFDAKVVEHHPARGVVLDRTAFYPGGGGQPSDAGALVLPGGAEVGVTRLKRDAGSLWHQFAEPAGVEIGSAVEGRIDWERRHALMRTHTALHVLCGVVWRDWGAQVTGGNMEPLKGRMDFEFEHLSKDLVGEIEARCNAEVEAARDVVVKSLPREEAFAIPDLIRTKINLLPEGIREVRTVDIVGLDLQADGGTHVANTREIGAIRVADYKSKGAVNKRIYLTIGG